MQFISTKHLKIIVTTYHLTQPHQISAAKYPMMKTVIVFLLIAGFFAPPSAISATKRLAIENFSLPSNSKLTSDIVTEDFKEIAKEEPGEYQIVLSTTEIKATIERLGKQLEMSDPDKVTLPPTPDTGTVIADFLLLPSIMQEENGKFIVLAKIYNMTSYEKFSVKQSGDNRDQALRRLWLAIRLYLESEVDTAYICKEQATEDFAILWPESKPDCSKVDELMSSVDNLKKEAPTRFKGKQVCANDYIAALFSELKKVVDHCGNECSEIGLLAGNMCADIFCQVSKVIGRAAQFSGLKDKPNINCGEPYRISCEYSFVSHTEITCSEYAKGTDFENYYSASRNGCCSYITK